MAKNAGRESGRRVPLKPIEFLLLAVLSDSPLHGYGIVREIHDRTQGKVRLRPGDVYRVIYRLRERGLLDDAGRQAPGDLDDERRTYYRITPLGLDVATEEAELLAHISAPLLSESTK